MNAEVINTLLHWIDNNIEGPLTIDNVAKKAGYSKWHLQRSFFRMTNITLGHYIRDKKLEHAARDLLNSDTRVIDISLKYGYESQQSFSRTFARKYRLPPGAWRQRYAA